MRSRLYSAGCLVFLLLLCRYSAACTDAVRAALHLCLTSVIPALFPFFVASTLAISCGLAQTIGALFAAPFRKLFHLPACGAAAMLLSFLGGYPAGARMAAELYHNKQCTREQASALAAVCNNTGPAFLIGMCGNGLFHSLRAGIFLYLVHIISALLTAFVLRPKTAPKSAALTNQSEFLRWIPLFVQAVLSAGRASLHVSAFVLVFSVILSLLRQVGIFSFLLCAFAPVFRTLSLSDGTGILIGMLELTQGLASLTPDTGTLAARLIAVSSLCAFGGCSVLFQTATVTEGLSFRACIRGKLVHAVLAFCLCLLAVSVVPTSWLETR